ncbi:MAG: PKD domain-containing protein [Flavobacteriales bacterium]|jgi:gliding motility-associated-like protein|nr:PKD domain-containing protein [Flavobacteriales bacterium]
MRFLVVVCVLILSKVLFSQQVNIYLVSPYYGSPIAGITVAYEASFGAGNVNVITGSTLPDYSLYDVVIYNNINQNYTNADVTAVLNHVQAGKHVVLSTEGSTVPGGRFMSTAWNSLTGQAITETGSGASGTSSPPRFHNSNGPWHLSPDPTINPTTGSYASFANFTPVNVTHQRNSTPPSCGNVQGVSAAYPARPNMGDGTLYIQGETWFPYRAGGGASQSRHAEAIARMHFAQLTNDQQLLTQLNTWDENLVIDDDFIGNDTLICKAGFVPFSRTCPTYASYSWEDVSGNVLATTATYTFLDSGTYIIRTTGTYPQCDGIDTLHIRFKSSPRSEFIADTVCMGGTTSFTNQSQIDAPGSIVTMTWDFGDGATSQAQAPLHTYSTAGSYNVQLTSVSDLNCIHDTTITVEVRAEPTASFSVVDDCLYTPPVINESSSVSSGSIVAWNWNFGDVLPSSIIQSTDQTPTHNYVQDGSYDITLIVVTAEGCDDTLVQTTTRFPIPEVSFISIPACKNDSVMFTNTSSINAPDNITSWVWNYGDGSPLVSLEEQNHKYTQDGYFNVTLIASSNNGCVSDVTNFVQVYPLPTAEFSFTTTCENGIPTSFFNLSSIAQGSIVNHNWDFGDNGAVSNNQFATYDYSASGTYHVELNIETANGCVDTVWHDVVVHPKPEANFIADVKEGCFPYCTQFQDNSQANATTITDYFWFFGNGEIETSQDPEICFGNSSHIDDAIYDASLIVTNDLGCKDTIVEVGYITVWPKPLAMFEASPEQTDMYNSEIAFQNLSVGGESFEWDYADGNQSIDFEEAHQYADTGVYNPQLIVTTVNGCKDTIQKMIQIDPVLNVYIPSAFTPDGDGVNDAFFVEGFAIDFDHFEFLIFDRWGTLMYKTEENRPWDGTYKGELAPQDVYVYQVYLRGPEGKDKSYTGHFTLLK